MSDLRPPSPPKKVVQFSKAKALPGVASGTLIALGAPAVTLLCGRGLPAGVQLTLSLVGLILGAAVALVAAFFAAVMPTRVSDDDGDD